MYDKYDTPDAVHYDLYAFAGADETTYFEMLVTERGKTPLARSVFAYEPAFDYMREIPELPFGLAPLRWRAATHDRFKRVHGRLLALCVVPPYFSVRHVLCHYVKPYDADPWPRNTVNTYRAPVYGEGKRPGRPRKAKVAPEDARAIDILMGVDVLDDVLQPPKRY